MKNFKFSGKFKSLLTSLALIVILIIAFFVTSCSVAEPTKQGTIGYPVYVQVNTGTANLTQPFMLGTVWVTANGTELNFVAGVTSSIQTQLNLKSPLGSPAFTGTVTLPLVTLGGEVSVNSKWFNGGADDFYIKSTRAGGGFYLMLTNDGASGANIAIMHESATPAVGDITGRFNFNGRSSTNAYTYYGYFANVIADSTNGSQDGRFDWYLIENGTPNYAMYLSSDGTLMTDNTPGTFDKYDDVDLLKRGIKLGDKQALVNAGILKPKTDDTGKILPDGYFINNQALLKLLAGGIYQLSDRVDVLELRIAELERRLK